jgi:hypothetical protein
VGGHLLLGLTSVDDSDVEEQARSLWRGSHALYQVAQTATQADPGQRYQSVANLCRAWRSALDQ